MASKNTISSVETAFDIIDILDDEENLSLTELVERLDLSKSTVYYYLNTLKERQYVRSTDSGYKLGSQPIKLGQQILQKNPLWELAKPYVDELAKETQLVACTAIGYGNDVILVYKSRGESAMDVDGTFEVGSELSQTDSAYGKAIFANEVSLVDGRSLDDAIGVGSREDEIQPSSLRDDFQTLRDVGFAYSDDIAQRGVRSVAAPVIDRESQTVLGAVGVSGTEESIPHLDTYAKERRFSEKLPNLVKRTSSTIEHQLADEG